MAATDKAGEVGAPTELDTGTLKNLDIQLYLPLREVAHVREFRLLRMHPADTHQLACELVPFRLHQSPSFRALSYTWKGAFDDDHTEAETSPTEEILVAGRPMTVGRNLADALRALRDWHGGDEQYVWADAICIDQSNFRERAYQVSIMGEIYSNADSVFIWLGPEAEDSDRAMNFIRALAKCRRDIDAGRARTIAMAQDPRCLPHWKALAALMNRRWWSRAWVLQETVLARRAEFCCGRALVGDEDLFDGARALRDVWDQIFNILQGQHDVQLRVPTYHAMDGMSRLRAARINGKLFNILTCHHRTMSPLATDPRDYIFAKMGMAADGYIVHPNYTDPVHEVYTNFVLDYIRETKSLEIIHFDARPRETPKLPSWVPDWAASFGASPLQPDPEANPGNTFRYYSASGGESAQVVIDDSSPGIIRCTGYLVDTIDGVAFAEEASWVGSEAARPMSQTRTGTTAYGDDDKVFEALWGVVTMRQDHHGNGLSPEAGATLATSFRDAIARLDGGPDMEDVNHRRFDHAVTCLRGFEIGGKTVAERMVQAATVAESVGTLKPVTSNERAEIETGMAHALVFRRLLTTEGGYVGTGPIDTEPGDVVTVLFGTSVPVILRPAGNGRYSVVGAGDIHGIMHGEAVDTLRGLGKATVEFQLI